MYIVTNLSDDDRTAFFSFLKKGGDTNVAAMLLKNKNYTNGGMPMNEKPVINANLLRKEPEFGTRVTPLFFITPKAKKFINNTQVTPKTENQAKIKTRKPLIIKDFRAILIGAANGT